MNLIFTLFAAVSALEPSVKDPRFSEKIEAKVGSQIITSTELETMMGVINQTAKDEPKTSVRKKALETLIDRALISIYLQQVGAPIEDREVDLRINSIKTQNGVKSQEDFKKLLSQQGMSFDEFRSQVRSQMEYMQFLNFMRRDASQSVEDKELRAYFKNNAKEFASTYEVTLQECTIPFGSNQAAAEKLANEFKNNPSRFNECVKNHSQSPTASSQGMIGSFKMGSLREDIERMVFDSNKNDVVIVRQPISYQLLKVIDRADLGPASFDSVKERLKAKLQEERIQKEIQKKLTELRSSTYIQI